MWLSDVGILCHAILEDGATGRVGDGMQDGYQYTRAEEGEDDAANEAEIAEAQQASQEAPNAGADDACNDVANELITAAARSDICQETSYQANKKPR
jgi:hypothetical protein